VTVSIEDVLAQAIESALLDVHTSIPGRIKSYDSETQRADVEIVIKRAQESASGPVVEEDYPVIPNVPIAWPKGGGYGITFPLNDGDHVWLIFSESAIGRWRTTGEVRGPGDLARHDLSYPIAIPCDAADANPLPASASKMKVTVASGGGVDISEDGGSAKKVAIAESVEANLDMIRSAASAAAP
jgi:hypothetical protein